MSIAPYVPSPPSVVNQMLLLADLKPDELLYDLGSGDGRVAIMAAEKFGARAVGIEMKEDLANRALSKILELQLQDKVKIINDNIFKIDVSPADVVTLYLTTSANSKLKPKLEAELKPGARVVSHDFEIVGWNPIKVDKFRENQKFSYPSHTIYVYRR